MDRTGPATAVGTAMLLLATMGQARGQHHVLQVPPDAVAFDHREHHTGSGMPQNTAMSIAPTRDGAVWIATYGGLCRHDGDRIQVFDAVTDPVLGTNRFTCLLEDRDGTLWVGTEQDGVVRRHDGRFVVDPERQDLHVNCLGLGADGELLVGCREGLWRRHDGHMVRLPGCHDQVLALLRDDAGTVLVATPHNVFRLEAGACVPIAQLGALCLAHRGATVFAGTRRGVAVLTAEGLVPWPPLAHLTNTVLSLFVARAGAVWVGTDQGAIRIDASAVDGEQPESRPLPKVPEGEVQSVRSFAEDHEGGIWIGLTERGACRLRTAEVRSHRRAPGMPDRGVLSMAVAADGTSFLCTSRLLLQWRDGLCGQVAGSETFQNFSDVALAPDGGIWFGCREGLGRVEHGRATIVAAPGDYATAALRAILVTAAGTVWLGGADGVACYENGVVSVPPALQFLRGHLIRRLATGPDGALWIGGGDRLVRLGADRATVRQWRCGEELPFGEVRGLVPIGPERIWIASYGGGLVHVDRDRVVAIDRRHGLVDPSVCALLTTPTHFVVGCNLGIGLVSRADLDAIERGDAATIGYRPLATEGSNPTEINGAMQGCAFQDRVRMWFCGIEDLLELDPTGLPRPTYALTTTIGDVYVGDTRVEVTPGLRLPPESRAVNLRLGTSAQERHRHIRYRWHMPPHHPEWTSPQFDRDVRLVGLPAGSFDFEAEAIDVDGRPSPHPARLALHVPPRLVERTAFWVVLAVGVLAGAFAMLRLGGWLSARRALRLQTLVDARTAELRAARLGLEQRVAERTAELRAALQHEQEATAERQRLERQLQQLQRMESLGHLAGGIAHDFNNLLTVVLGSSELLAAAATSPADVELCEHIRAACARGRNMTQHLLAVASRQVVAPTRLDLRAAVLGLEPVLRSLLGEDVRLSLDAAEPVFVRAATTQIEQVLINLAANARHAMPRGGTFTIRVAGGEAVALEVRDTGVGMTPDVLERAFEPFFTTRRDHGGRGLGLATVYGIVKQLGGTVRLESAPGQGTAVYVSLPPATGAERREATAAASAASSQPAGRMLQLDAYVLLVEDQDDVRSVLRRLLQSLGCRVVDCADGSQAVAALAQTRERIDVVLSDVVMPGLHGTELVRELRRQRPDLPILFTSGHADGRLSHQDLRAMGLEILPKPPDRAQLADALRTLLTAADRPDSLPTVADQLP